MLLKALYKLSLIESTAHHRMSIVKYNSPKVLANMNQIFCDNDFDIDSSIFQFNSDYEKFEIINSYFNEDEAWDIVFEGAEKFISDKYDSEYLNLND